MTILQKRNLQMLFQNGFLIFIAIILQCQNIKTAHTQPTSLGVSMERSPESIVAPQGDEVLFECQLNLDPERLEWRFRPLNSQLDVNQFIYLHKNAGFNISNEGGTSKLRIYVSSDTLGEYQCVAWYGASAIASIPARLTLASVSLEGDIGMHVNRPEQILEWRVSPKNSVLIKCGNVVSNPSAVWSFFKDNVPISQSEPQLPSGALILSSVSQKHSGTYYCTAVNAITGTELKLPQKVQLIVEHTPRSAPHFLIHPSNQTYGRPSQTVVLECPGIGNPPPKAVWSRPDANSLNNRTTILDYGLQITNVTAQDQGTYVCRLDNGIAPARVHTTRLDVLEPPVILKGPPATLTNESESLELDCDATGSPIPAIYWMINGADTRWDPTIKHYGSKMIINAVEKKHAGIVQCFARNDVGEAIQSNLLLVSPKQIPGEISMTTLGRVPTKSTSDHPGKQNKGRKKHKIPNMIPPSRPNVTRLSDDSVMIRWNVPNNDGLPIQFFKVQYRMLGNPARNIPRENWQTTNDDIPYGKRDKNNNGFKNFTSAVTGLKPDRYYRFRILAVYSNNDNKEGNSSGKFLLQKASQLGPSKGHLTAPILTKVEGISETEIVLHWNFPINRSNPVDGFYAYYRPASTAGEYTKSTVDGMHTRYFKIDMLEPGTAYEFKLQSFTASTASDFSSILTGKTFKPATPPTVVTPSVVPASTSSEDTNSIFPVIAGAVGGIFLLVVAAVVVCFCLKKRKKAQRDDENKAQLDHIQQDAPRFVPPNVMGPQHHKTGHRMNGVMPRMNITANPLAQEADKNRNVMELRFMPTTGGSNQHIAAPSVPHHNLPSVTGGLPPHHHHAQQQQAYHHQHQMGPAPSSPTGLQNLHHQPHHHHHHQQQQQPQPQSMSQQNNNHHTSSIPQPTHHLNNFQAPLTPSLEQHRRTLERSARNLHYLPPGPPHHHSSGTGLDVADGIPTKIPSLRRTRRTSGSANNNNGGVSNGNGVPGSPRVQRSPMPVRAAVSASAIKRNRLGSHTENMSSGSLNSIEV